MIWATHLQGVAAEKDLGDDLRIEPDLAIAGEIEQRLDLVRQRVHRHEAKKPGDSLDGVKRPEDGVERLGLVWLQFEGEQRRLDLLEVFDGFGVELREQLTVLIETEVKQDIDRLGEPVVGGRAGRGGGRRSGGGWAGVKWPDGLFLAGLGDCVGQPFHEAAEQSERRFIERTGGIEQGLDLLADRPDRREQHGLGCARFSAVAEQTEGGDQAVVATGLARTDSRAGGWIHRRER